MSEHNTEPSDIDRVVALKALREYMYLQSPIRHGMADFIEDVPKLRPYGAFAQDLAPSAAVVSQDPQERHKQIQQALQSVEHLHGHKSELGKQTLRSAGAGALGSVPLSLLFGGATRLLSHGKGPMHMLRNPEARGSLLSGLGEDVSHGVGYGAATGAIAPALTKQVNPSHKALQQAAHIMQNSPYAAGLPGGDITTAMNYNKKESKPYQLARSGAVGAGFGALAGVSGGALSSAADYASTGVGRKLFGSSKPMPKLEMGNVRKPGLIGAGLGAGFGLLASALQ